MKERYERGDRVRVIEGNYDGGKGPHFLVLPVFEDPKEGILYETNAGNVQLRPPVKATVIGFYPEGGLALQVDEPKGYGNRLHVRMVEPLSVVDRLGELA